MTEPLSDPLERKANVFIKIVDKIGVAGVILGIAIGWASGWIPFEPLDSLRKAVAEHDKKSEIAAHAQLEILNKLNETLEKFSRILARYERRDRLIECSARYSNDQKMLDKCLAVDIFAGPQ